MDLQFISGPMSWYHFEFVDDDGNPKTIHLFSDIHDFTKLCPKSFQCKNSKSSPPSKCFQFDYFLETYFEKAIQDKKYVDFFLESPYRLNQKELKINPNKNYLDLVNHRFQKCLSSNKKGCKYLPNIRMHYTDVRIPDYNYITIGSFIGEMYFFLVRAVYLFHENQITKNDLIQVLNVFHLILDIVSKNAKDISLIMMTENNFESKVYSYFLPVFDWIQDHPGALQKQMQNKIQHMLDQLFSLVKIRKGKRVFIVKQQLDQLRKDDIRYKGKNMADIILSYFIEFSNVLSDRAKQLNLDFWHKSGYAKQILELDPKNAKKLFLELYDQRKQVLQNNILFDLTYLDTYILARMFRKFTNKDSSSAIVYAGNLHIESEKDFFILFLDLIPIHAESNLDQERCLSNPNFQKVFYD